MEKYYRVIKENPLWEVGAILKNFDSNGCGGYSPIDEVFCKEAAGESGEYLTAKVVETETDFFERVYKINLASRVIFDTREKAKKAIEKAYKGAKNDKS